MQSGVQLIMSAEELREVVIVSDPEHVKEVVSQSIKNEALQPWLSKTYRDVSEIVNQEALQLTSTEQAIKL